MRNPSCERWTIFEGLNDWEIIDIKHNSVCSNELIELETDVILEDNAHIHSQRLKKGSFGVISMEGDKKWSVFQYASDPFPFSEKNTDDGFEVHDHFDDDELVVNTVMWIAFKGAKNWYSIPEEKSKRHSTISLRKVIASDIEMKPISVGNQLPSKYPQGVPPFKKQRRYKDEQMRMLETSRKMSSAVYDEIQMEV